MGTTPVRHILTPPVMVAGDSSRNRLRVLVLGAFPPQAQGIPGYCAGLVTALADSVPVVALGFKAMYPSWLFPGVNGAMDPTAATLLGPNLDVKHALAWYNPLGWCWPAFRSPVDVMHLQWWSLPLFPVLLVFALAGRWRGLPVVITVHNVLPHEPSPWFLRASRLLYRFADHLVVHSETNRAQLINSFNVSEEQVSYIPMGIVATPDVLPSKEEAGAVLCVEADRPTLLFFGNIRPYKGLDVLLQALAIVCKSHPEVLLVIAGKVWGSWQPYLEQIEKLKLGVHLNIQHGYVPESHVRYFYALADLVVLPYTHFDAQSAVGVQALHYGKPLLVTATGGLSELVGGDAAYCVPPKDVAALAAALIAFLDNPQRATARFQERARAAAHAMSWSKSATAHIDLYRRLLG